MVECFACDVNAGRIGAPGDVIYEDEYWRAEHGIDRLVRGYVVLKPKRHAPELPDLIEPESAGLGPAMQRLIQAMRSALGTERVYVCSFGALSSSTPIRPAQICLSNSARFASYSSGVIAPSRARRAVAPLLAPQSV